MFVQNNNTNSVKKKNSPRVNMRPINQWFRLLLIFVVIMNKFEYLKYKV